MMTVLLKILSILGILLLVVLGGMLAVLLLVLFLPIIYRVEADRRLSGTTEADGAEQEPVFLMKAAVKVNWFFGLLRFRYCYPEPGVPKVMLLWFSLTERLKGKSEPDGKNEKGTRHRKAEKAARKGKKKPGNGQAAQAAHADSRKAKDSPSKDSSKDSTSDARTEDARTEEARTEEAETPDARISDAETSEAHTSDAHASEETAETRTESGEETSGPAAEQKRSLFEKIRCTIQEICGKIKKIRENLEFYRELLLCDDTRGLLDHGFRRLGKILKSIRPRRLKADIHFGTGSPDTTGYILGIYGMLSPHLGRHVTVRPDFEQAVLEGRIFAAGHITVFQLLRHGVMFILDKRLRRLMRKRKAKDAAEKGNK